MSEIGEAVQVVEIPFRVFGQTVTLILETTEFVAKIAKAVSEHNKEQAKKMLSGEVTMDKLTRVEGNNLSTARFEEVDGEELKKVLNQYGIPYVEMPDTEVNGVHYSNITFAGSYRDRVNAVIQHFGGDGEIIDDKSIPKYIESGEVSLQVLMTQNGSNLMAYQFPESHRNEVLEMLNAAGIKYAVLPDLNLKDGMCEVAYSPQQNIMMESVMKRFKESKTKTMKEYMENADEEHVTKLSKGYQNNGSWIEDAIKRVFVKIEEQGIDLQKPIPVTMIKDKETGIEKPSNAIDDIIDDVLEVDINNGMQSIKELFEARKRIRQAIEQRKLELFNKASGVSL